ncbi:MAG: GntR family transcriptional regulator [Bacillales bacterium]|nr:GntR family transcriptional regulator [Bacillales bacterium]
MDYEKNIPLYIQVKNDIYRKIENREYTNMLPSEKLLVELYDVSRVTLRKALEVLEEEGLISRKAGFGTVIKQNLSELKNFTMVKSLTNEMKEIGAKNIETFSSTISILYANKEMMDLFSCDSSKKLYNLRRLRGVNEKPIVFSNTWLNIDIDLPTSKDFLFGSLYDFLISNNVFFSRFEEELEAIMPTREYQDLLKLDKDGVILKRIRKGFDSENKLIEYTINYYDAKLYRYSVEVASIERIK